jgi:hypothetical protein
MPLIKQPLDISFAQGLDTKTDPFRVQPGKFLTLQNSIFDKAGRLTKRNGYGNLPSLPDETSKFVTTFNDNLTAIGTSIQALGQGSSQWINKGSLQPISLSTLTLVKSNTGQSQSDSVVSPNGYVCTVYTDNVPVSGSNVKEYKYVIADSTTGQNIVEPTLLPPLVGAVTGSPRVFLLGTYFFIIYTSGTTTQYLCYLGIGIYSPNGPKQNGQIGSSSYISSPTLSWDGVVYDNVLYLAYNTIVGGQHIGLRTISQNLIISAETQVSSQIATMITLAVDSTVPSTPIIYVSYYNSGTSLGYVFAVSHALGLILSPTQIIASGTILNLASTAQNGSVTVFQEVSNKYTYDSSIPTHYIQSVTVSQTGTVGSTTVTARSVGLASKAFLYNGISYFLSIYYSLYQPTYFLLNGSGNVISVLSYSNSGSYYTTGLPSAMITDDVVQISYLYKDLLQSINTTQGATVSAGVYTQTGINLVSFDMNIGNIVTSEIGNNLNISGGFVSSYDGYQAVEQNFFVWPDNVELSATTGGSMSGQQYFYQATYEWTDNQGNLFRSSPSIPVSITLSGSNNAVVVNVPTLRLTYKTSNPVAIVIYRWSAAQQVYYQVTSITVPTLNVTTVDSIAYTDTLADSSIIGNNILYTTGGVIEDEAPPASNILTLFDDRLWLVDSEDPNLLWFSKQVIEATPVEMSSLLTVYVPPTTASNGSTGPITALSPMDDKLVIFKQNALGYLNGTGPDNTGANNNYSNFVLITSVVGCTNQQSIVFMPQGLMFQSNKGIWLLGRDLSTNYIGAPVESLTTGTTVESAVNIPYTNQVRFTLDSGITLVYDYYFNQWGTFTNVPAISSTIYQNLHTYINSLGQVFQETPGSYIDSTSPVLMSFTTGWISLAGLQGYERFYSMYLLGSYITPFKLNIGLAYDYNPSLSQQTIITPNAPASAWGGDALWGDSTPWGGQSSVFDARLFPQKQKCESFQISVTEIYDPSYSIAAGEGLTLSGLNLIVGIKKPFRTQSASRSFG